MRKITLLFAILASVGLSSCTDSFAPAATVPVRPDIVFTRAELSNPSDLAKVMVIKSDGSDPTAIGNGVIVSKPAKGKMIWSRLIAPGVSDTVIISDYIGHKRQRVTPKKPASGFLGGYDAAMSRDGMQAALIVAGREQHEYTFESSWPDTLDYGDTVWIDINTIYIKKACNFTRVRSVPAFTTDGNYISHYVQIGETRLPNVASEYVMLSKRWSGPGMDTCRSAGIAAPYQYDATATIDWSSDGKYYTFSFDTALVISGPGSKFPNLSRPFALGSSLVFSPDGRKLAYSSLDGDIMIKNFDGTGEINLTNTPGVFEAYPQWSPDGSRILCTSYNGFINQGDGTLEVIDIASQSKTAIYTPAYKGFWLPYNDIQ